MLKDLSIKSSLINKTENQQKIDKKKQNNLRLAIFQISYLVLKNKLLLE